MTSLINVKENTLESLKAVGFEKKITGSLLDDPNWVLSNFNRDEMENLNAAISKLATYEISLPDVTDRKDIYREEYKKTDTGSHFTLSLVIFTIATSILITAGISNPISAIVLLTFATGGGVSSIIKGWKFLPIAYRHQFKSNKSIEESLEEERTNLYHTALRLYTDYHLPASSADLVKPN